MSHSRRAVLMLLGAIAGAALTTALGAGRDLGAQEAPTLPPVKRAELHAWVSSLAYRADYLPEPEIHASTGPHGGNVRTWFSPSLVEDLRAGKRRFRKGAVLVKELYGSSGTALTGWAVMIKTRNARPKSRRAWVWYETFSLDGGGGFYGRGLGLCTSCHAQAGPDFLRSTYRP